VNGEGIYGTRYAGRACQWTDGKQPEQQFGEYMVKYNLLEQVGQQPKNGNAVKQAFFTRKGETLYAITVGWPGKQFTVKDVTTAGKPKVSLLGYDGTLQCHLKGSNLVIDLPDLGPESLPTRYAYTLKLEGVRWK
jgi:alpha-L-fucosidase